MITILVDHNIEGNVVSLWGILAKDGWGDLIPLRLFTFADVNLPFDSDDRAVWRFAQQHRMLLLTDNRNMKGDDSLELTLREKAGLKRWRGDLVCRLGWLCTFGSKEALTLSARPL